MPKQKPLLSRSVQRVYAKAIAESGERIARLRGDPAAIERAARERAFAQFEQVAETMPTAKRLKIVPQVKRGLHRT